jgi:hypothetical protein
MLKCRTTRSSIASIREALAAGEGETDGSGWVRTRYNRDYAPLSSDESANKM